MLGPGVILGGLALEALVEGEGLVAMQGSPAGRASACGSTSAGRGLGSAKLAKFTLGSYNFFGAVSKRNFAQKRTCPKALQVTAHLRLGMRVNIGSSTAFQQS